jgi:hypothetical protein
MRYSASEKFIGKALNAKTGKVDLKRFWNNKVLIILTQPMEQMPERNFFISCELRPVRHWNNYSHQL